MRRSRRIAVAAATALTLWLGSHLALAQKSGGVLKMPDFASPASMSIHEEVTRAAVTVLMPVFRAKEGDAPVKPYRNRPKRLDWEKCALGVEAEPLG